MSLEPSREDFARRDAAGLCVACGENPQPDRKDSGPSPTHHRCDPCWKRYQPLKNLRDRMLHGEGWRLVPNDEACPCGLCGQNILRSASVIRTSSVNACSACVDAADFYQSMTNRGAHVAPLLRHATVGVRSDSDSDGEAVDEGVFPNTIVFTFPPAMPAMIGLAFHTVRRFWARGVLCGCGPHTLAVEFKAIVQIGSQDQDVPELVSAVTSELVRFCACVKVPRAFYRAARNMVYETHGNPLARRVKRVSVKVA